MRIAKFEEIITPPVGTSIAGYGPYDETYRKVGELVLSLLALDDGKNKALILGYDLIGMDEALVDRVRSAAAAAMMSAGVVGFTNSGSSTSTPVPVTCRLSIRTWPPLSVITTELAGSASVRVTTLSETTTVPRPVPRAASRAVA